MSQADDERFLSRWSRLKREEREKPAPVPAAPAEAHGEGKDEAPPPLPPVETLTPQSDFAGFMHPKVQDSLRRLALKKLFSDPHFNVPDLNEAYSGDWTGGEPITKEMLAQLNQTRTLLFSDEERRLAQAADEKAQAEATAQAQSGAAAQAPEPPEQTQEFPQDTKPDEPGRQDA